MDFQRFSRRFRRMFNRNSDNRSPDEAGRPGQAGGPSADTGMPHSIQPLGFNSSVPPLYHLSPPDAAKPEPPPPPSIMTWPTPESELSPVVVKLAFQGPIDPQLSSPLYNGLIPAEIRTMIFELALSEDTIPHGPLKDHDFHIRHDHGQDECEPELEPLPEEAPQEESSQTAAQPATQDGQPAAAPQPAPPAAPVAPPRWTAEESNNTGYDWFRPGYTGRKYMRTDLLLTCRRVYLEAFHIPATAREHLFFSGDRARHPPWWRLGQGLDMKNHFEHRVPFSAARLAREIHIVPQMFWLERSFLPLVTMSTALKQQYSYVADARRRAQKEKRAGGGAPDEHEHEQGEVAAPPPPPPSMLLKFRLLDRLETLRITLRHRDWWWNEYGTPLCINPFNPGGGDQAAQQRMRFHMEAARRGEPCPVTQPNGWGAAFAHMPSLRRLVINFETTIDKKAELEEIVAWAKTWRFVVYHDAPPHVLRHERRDYGERQARRALYAATPVAGGASATYARSWLEAVDDDADHAAPGPAARALSWRGLPHHWAVTCPACRPGAARAMTPTCMYCRKREVLLARGLGPRLILSTVRWVARREEKPKGTGEGAGGSGGESGGTGDGQAEGEEGPERTMVDPVAAQRAKAEAEAAAAASEEWGGGDSRLRVLVEIAGAKEEKEKEDGTGKGKGKEKETANEEGEAEGKDAFGDAHEVVAPTIYF